MGNIWLLGVLFTSICFGAYTPKNRPYDVEKYALTLSLDPSQVLTEFTAENKITLTAKEPLNRLELDREALVTKSVEQQGTKKGATKWKDDEGNLLTIELAKPAKKGDKIVLTVAYTGKIGENHTGFFRVTDPDAPERGPLYFTNFEPLAAKTFFPCNDEPYDKAAVEITVTLPQGYDAISNGKKVSDKKIAKNKQHEVKWLQEKPHSTYLLSLAIGKFAVLEDSKKGSPIFVYANEKKISRAQYTAEVTRKSMDTFEEFLGTPYPWDKYATVGLPTFLWGGMENTSSTHMNEERMLLNDPKSTYERTHVAGLVAHELAHQWFGNYVTLKWWNDVWLNEAFATYMTLVAEKKIFPNENPELTFVSDTWNTYFKQEDGPRSHAIVQETISSPEDGFDSISYTKGANVLRMLSFYIGEERFRKALRLYLKNHGQGNATYADFFKSVESATGEDLTAFRDSWLLHRGYPIVHYSGTWDTKASSYALTIKQKPNHPEDKTLFRFRMPVTFQRKTAPQYVKTVSFTTGDAERTFKFDLPAEPQSVTVNTGGVVLARVKADGIQEKDLATHAFSNPDAVTRFWAVMELGDNLEDGKPLSAFAEKTIGYVLQNDPSPYVRATILQTLQRSPEQNLPKALSETIVRLAKESLTPAFETSSNFKQDTLGWSAYRSALLGCLGHVGTEEATVVLEKSLNRLNLPLDDLMQASTAMAQIGGDKALTVLKTALKNHSARGYRYQYYVQLAFASLRDKRAVDELKTILASCGPDLAGYMGHKLSSNPTVKGSSEWANFLKDFLVSDRRLGEEVKARILSSIEHEKNPDVKRTLEYVSQNGKSERIRALSKQILDKNFGSGTAVKGG